MTDVDPTERRQFARLLFQGALAVAPIPRSLFNTPLRAVAEDLSERGVRLVAPEPFPVGVRLVVDLELPDRDEPLYTLGRVVWSVRIPDEGRWRIAVAFTSLSMGARERLHRIVAEWPTSRPAS